MQALAGARIILPGIKDTEEVASYLKNKVYKIIRLDEVIAAHKMTIETDYERIKEAAIKEKKSIATEKWIKTHLNDYYIKISDDYKQCPFKQNWLRK